MISNNNSPNSYISRKPYSINSDKPLSALSRRAEFSAFLVQARDDGDNLCPLCMEEMDSTDKQSNPCKMWLRVFVNLKKDFDKVIYLSKMSIACSEPHILGTGASDHVEFIDPAIMAVGKGKLPGGSLCSSSAIHDSHCVGLLPPSVLEDDGSCSFFGDGSHLIPHPNHVDYGSRIEMSKQRAFLTNSNLVSSRQQFMFADQVGNMLTSYLHSQKDAILPCKLVEQMQPNLNAQFSQLPFHQPGNALFRSSSVGTNG